jgi:non-ribosomal peptide synthetase component F
MSSAGLSEEEKRALLKQLLQERAAQKNDTKADEKLSASLMSHQLRTIPVQNRDRKYFPLSFSQQRMWLLEQLEPGNPAYHLPITVRLTGKLNVACLEKVINEIVARHEILRTNIDVVDGRPVQIISAVNPLPLTLVDLSDLAPEEKSKQLQRLVEKAAKEPFDLRRDSLIRVSLLRLNQQEHMLLLNMHHIATDAWSINIFWREFAALYKAFIKGQASPLPPLPIQYADFAQWQHPWLEGEILEKQLDYWKKQLAAPLHVLNLPTDHSRPKSQTFDGAKQSLTLSESLTKDLKKLSRDEGATLFMVLLAAFNVLLYRHTGQSDVVIGSPIAGRNRAEVEALIGFFINTIVLRTSLEGLPSFRQLL